MNLLNRLKIWQKLALLITSLGIPVLLLSYLLVSEKDLAINFARQEIRGLQYLQPVRVLLQHFAEHRGMSNAYLSGDDSFREKMIAKRNHLAEDIKTMDAINAQYGNALESSSAWQSIKTDWQNISVNVSHLTAPDSFARHTALIEKLLDLTINVGIASNLVLDPDADSYYLMDVVVNRLPFLIEHLGQLRGMATGIATRHQIADEERIRLMKLPGQVEMMQEGVQSSLKLAFKSNGSLKLILGSRQNGFAPQVGAFLTLLERLARSGETMDGSLSPSGIFAAGTQAIEAGLGLYDAAAPALLDLLQTRIAGLNARKFTALAWVLFSVAFVLLLAYGITQALNQSFRQAQQVAADLAAGELNNAITVTSRDEVGQLLVSLQATQHKLTTVVAEINTAADTVSSAAAEIAQGSADLSRRTEQQALALEETAASMEQLTATVKQSADNAGQANQLARAARDQAEQGGQVLEQAITAMSAIHQSSRQIADIIGVIDEIAFQTNLLALNAAVEAARAGQQGRGFAVVAGEVRKLAQRSADAAKEIKGLISDSVNKVEGGSQLVKRSGQTLQEIVNAVRKVSDIVAEMADAAQEQASGIEQVNQAIVQMDQATQQNAALVEQTAAASQSMIGQAQGLRRLMDFFKLGKRIARPSATVKEERGTAPASPTPVWMERGLTARYGRGFRLTGRSSPAKA